MKYIFAVLLMGIFTGCSTLETVCDLILIFDEDDEPQTGTVIMDDGTRYHVVVEEEDREEN